MIRLKSVKKFVAVVANLSLLLNSFIPFLLTVKPAYAQSSETVVSTITYNQSSNKLNISTNTSEKVAYQLFYKTNEKIDAIAGNDLSQKEFYFGTCSSGDCLPQNVSRGILKIKSDAKFYSQFFTLENSVLTITKESESSQSDLTDEENNFLENKTSSNWTFEKVELNKEYVAPQNSQVKLTFTKLPENSGNIKIEEITLTQEQITQTGSLSNKAYDITSDMIDGTFAYNLSLPIPESSKGQDVDIKFAEDVTEINNAQIASNTTETNSTVSAANLNHFTLFIVVGLNGDTQPVDGSQDNATWVYRANAGATTNLITDPTGSVPENLRTEVVKMDAPGLGRSFLGYTGFSWKKLKDSQLKEISWYKYANKAVDDHYLNLYISKYIIARFASVVIVPNCSGINIWENCSTNNATISVKDGSRTVNFNSFTDLMSSEFANWYFYNDTDTNSSLALVSGSSTTNSDLLNYIDGVRFVYQSGSNDNYNFENENDTTRPTVSFSPNAPTNTINQSTLTINITFSEPVNELLESELILTNATVNSFSKTDNQHYQVNLKSINDGEITFQIPKDVVFDNVGLGNAFSEIYKVTIDTVKPIITLDTYSTAPTNQNITVTAHTNEGSLNIGSTTFTTNGSFTFTASDDAGNITTKTVDITNIDKAAPVIRVTSPLINSYSKSPINISGTVTDFSSGALSVAFHIYKVNSNGTIGELQRGCTSIPGSINGNNWSAVVNNGTSCQLGDGYYEIAAWAYDKANNPGWAPRSRFYIDNTAPIITVNPFTTNDKTPALSGIVNDNTAVISVKIGSNTFFATNNNNGTWTLVDNTITPALADGKYNIIATATDTAGNVGTDTTTNELTIDTVAPNATHKYYKNGTEVFGLVYVKNVNELTFDSDVTDSDPSSGLRYETFSIFDANSNGSFGWNRAYCGFRQSANTYLLTGTHDISLTGKRLTDCITTLSEGNYYVMYGEYDNAARGTDTAVTQYRDVLGLHFIVDKTAPTITLGAYTTAPTNQDITVTATSSDGSLNVGSTTFTTNGSFDFVATDDAGNTTTETVTINNIDKTIPTSTNNLNNIVSGTVTITQQITDNNPKSGKLRIWKLINGIPNNSQFFAIGDLLVNSENKVVYNLNTLTNLFGDGEYRAKFTATDIAGNQSTVQKDFIVDNTAPTSTINGGSNDETIYSNNWDGSILGTATDNLSGVNEVKISIKNGDKYYDGTSFTKDSEFLLNTNYSDGNWEYSDLSSPFEGIYTIKSHAIDNAGNTENTYTLTIVLDQTIDEVALSIDPLVADASNGWYKTQPTITLTQTDANFDRIEYQWDSQTGIWTNYNTTPFKLMSEGGHVLYYRAVDKANNISKVGIKNIAWDQTDLEYGPQNISANPNPTSGSTSKIKWEFAKDNIGIDKYEIQWRLTGDYYSKTVSAGTSEVEIDNLTEGKWTVNVIAYDQSGRSKTNSIDLNVDRTGPTAPTLTLTNTGTGTATLSWNAITDAKDYIIWYGSVQGIHNFGARVGNVTSYTVRGLGTGNYYFIVKAVDEAQNQSADSNEINTGTITGAVGTIPGQPAEGFTSEVLGANTEEKTPTSDEGNVLGVSEEKGFNWWCLLLILFVIPLYVGGRKIFNKKK